MRRLIGILVLSAAAVVAGVAVSPSPASAQSVTCTGTRDVLADAVDAFGDPLVITLPVSGTTTSCLLARGNSGSAVLALQRTLNRCYSASLQLDGVFGNLTFQALRSAQAAAGTAVDGVYGRNTRDAFDRDRGWRAFSINRGQPTGCAGIA